MIQEISLANTTFKKIEHLNISMPHFQKGHEIKFFLGQTSCMICSVIITKQHGCTIPGYGSANFSFET